MYLFSTEPDAFTIPLEKWDGSVSDRGVGRRSRPEKSEAGLLVSNSRKANVLGWSREVTLLDGLRATAEYVCAHFDDYHQKGYVI
jgi:hypothetical protein